MNLGVNVAIEGFCSAMPPLSFIGNNDRQDYVVHDRKTIARIEAMPKWLSDPLEPRPWLSWSDCHVLDRIAPVYDGDHGDYEEV